MSSKNLENLIILLLVGIIIYMIYKRNEHFDNSAKNQEEVKQELQPKVVQYVSKVVPEVIPEVVPEVVPEVAKQNEIEGNAEYPYDSNLPPAGKTRSENENEFLNEYMNYSRFGNKIEHITTDEEINEYRKSFLDFRNVTNTSSHGFDPVDEMNLAKISGLYKDGLKVKDVYDKISATNFDKSKIDVASMQFNEKVDNYIRSNTFEYENDEVSNGGFFFEKIRGNENTNELSAFP